METTALILLTLIYLVSFSARNIMVKVRTKEQIRSKDPLVDASIFLTALCISTALVSTRSEPLYGFMGPIFFLRSPVISYIGLFLFGCSIIMGWVFSSQLKKSWRVGVPENQKTDLIQSGIYAHIRNPYFLSIFVMLTGLFLVRPSVVLAGFLLLSIVVFHRMVLKEEAYLLKTHGETYHAYQMAAGRYVPRVLKSDR